MNKKYSEFIDDQNDFCLYSDYDDIDLDKAIEALKEWHKDNANGLFNN